LGNRVTIQSKTRACVIAPNIRGFVKRLQRIQRDRLPQLQAK